MRKHSSWVMAGAVAGILAAASATSAQTLVTSIDISTEIGAANGIHAAHIAVDTSGATPILYVNSLNNSGVNRDTPTLKIADPLGTPAVSVLDLNTGTGTGAANSRGSGGVAVDGAGNVFVGWTGNGNDDSARVRRYDAAGSQTGEWTFSGGLNDRLGGLDVNAAGTAFVGARFLSTATKLGHYQVTGASTLTRTFSGTPAGATAQNPRDVAFDAVNSKIYINANGNLEVITAGTSSDLAPETNWLAANGATAETLQAPGVNSFAGYGVAVSDDGVWVGYSPSQNTGEGANTFRLVNTDGQTMITLGQLNTPGDGTGELLRRPVDGAFFTAGGTNYVAISDYAVPVAGVSAFSRVAIFELPDLAPSVRVVDGVGARRGGVFATIAEALEDLAASPDNGDTAKDIISVTANVTETSGTVVDKSVLLDEVEIDGGGNTVVYQSSAVTTGVVINIISDDLSVTTIRNMTILPEDDPSTGTVQFAGAAIRTNDVGTTITGSTVNLVDLLITSSTAGNAPVDPDAAAPEDRTNWVFGVAPIFAGGIRTDSTSGGVGNVVNITDVTVAHTNSRGLYFAQTAGTDVIATRATSKYNNGNGIRTFSTTGNITLNNCIVENNIGASQSGMTTAGTTTPAAVIEINGGSFSFNAFYGLEFNAANTIRVNGTDGDPVWVMGGPNRGMRFNNASIVCPGLSYMVIADNASYGFDVNEMNTDASWGDGINEMIFSGNATLSVTPRQFSYGDTHSTPKTIEVTNVTFHNPGGTQGETFTAANFHYRFGSELTWNFTDCIFTGVAGDLDVAIELAGTGANRVVNLTNCAVATDPAAYGNILSAVTSGSATGLTINEVSVITSDPVYVETADPTSASFLDVQNNEYGTAGSGGSALSGGADFVGGINTGVSDWTVLDN